MNHNKKCCALLAAITLAASLFSVSSTASSSDYVLMGDVNEDGKVSSADSFWLSRYLSGDESAEWIDTFAADVDLDGYVTPRDNMILERYLSGWDGYETLPYEFEGDTVAVITETPYSTVTIDVDTIPRGTTEVVSEGKNGINETYYGVWDVGGGYVVRTYYGESTASAPVDETCYRGVGGTLVGNDGETYSYSYRKTVTATYYNLEGYTFTGVPVSNQVIATNPKTIPMGTKLYVKNDRYDFGVRTAADTGHLAEWQIDIWMSDDDPNYPLMSREGRVRDMEIYYLD